MSRVKKVTVKLNNKRQKQLLEEVKGIFDLKGKYGADSKAIRKALEFTRDRRKKFFEEFEMRYGPQDKFLIKKHLENQS